MALNTSINDYVQHSLQIDLKLVVAGQVCSRNCPAPLPSYMLRANVLLLLASPTTKKTDYIFSQEEHNPQ